MKKFLFSISIFVSTHPIFAEIRLASFCIGEVSVHSNLEQIADLIQSHDFLAIQGFREAEIIDPLISILFRRGDYYKFLTSKPTGNNDWRYAFAWRNSKIQISSPPIFIDTQFEHQVLKATFRSKNFKFTAINFQGLSTEENYSELSNIYHELKIQTTDELDVVFFTALPSINLPNLNSLSQVVPQNRRKYLAGQQLFPAIYLNKKSTREFTGKTQQIDPEKLILNNKNSSLNPSLGWAEFDNKLIDDDPLQSLIENHTWGKIKNTPRRIKNFVK